MSRANWETLLLPYPPPSLQLSISDLLSLIQREYFHLRPVSAQATDVIMREIVSVAAHDHGC